MSEPLAPGIYFGLDSDIYHADRALSRSGLVHLLDTPNTYWVNSWMNPETRIRKISKEMIYGTAADLLLFEPKKFKEKFQVVPTDPWAQGKTKIDKKQFDSIISSIKLLRAGGDSAKSLSGGYPHVTIVFEWNGYLFRCEHDYFKINSSTDYKSVHSLDDWHLKASFRDYGLDIQMALYKKSRTRFKEQYAEGTAHVYGNPDPEFFEKFLKSEMNEFMFIFQRTTEPHPYEPIFPEDDTEESGCTKIQEAVRVYDRNLKLYGTKTPWPVCTGKPVLFSMFYGRRKDEY